MGRSKIERDVVVSFFRFNSFVDSFRGTFFSVGFLGLFNGTGFVSLFLFDGHYLESLSFMIKLVRSLPFWSVQIQVWLSGF